MLVHETRGQWHRWPGLLFPQEKGAQWCRPCLLSRCKGLSPSPSLGGGQALADPLQLTRGHGGFFPPSCTKKGTLIPSHWGLENPTGRFAFKLLLNGAREQLPASANGSKIKRAPSSSIPGSVQPLCAGSKPLLQHGRPLPGLPEAGETPAVVKFGRGAHREHPPAAAVRMCRARSHTIHPKLIRLYLK